MVDDFDFTSRDWMGGEETAQANVFLAAPHPPAGRKSDAKWLEDRIREACRDGAAAHHPPLLVEVTSEHNAPAGDLATVTAWLADTFVTDIDGLIALLWARSTGCGLALAWARHQQIPTLVVTQRDLETPTGLLPEHRRGEWETVIQVNSRRDAISAAHDWVRDMGRELGGGTARRRRRVAEIEALRQTCRARWYEHDQPRREDIAASLKLPLDHLEDLVTDASRASVALAGDLLALARALDAPPTPLDIRMPWRESQALQEAADQFPEVRRNWPEVYLEGLLVIRSRPVSFTKGIRVANRSKPSRLTNPYAWRDMARRIEREQDARGSGKTG